MATEVTRRAAQERTVALPDRYTCLPLRGCTGRNVSTILFPSTNLRLENILSCGEKEDVLMRGRRVLDKVRLPYV